MLPLLKDLGPTEPFVAATLGSGMKVQTWIATPSGSGIPEIDGLVEGAGRQGPPVRREF